MRQFQRWKTIVIGSGEQIQADLIDVKKHANDNDYFKYYILTAIDVSSQKARAIHSKINPLLARLTLSRKYLLKAHPDDLK